MAGIARNFQWVMGGFARISGNVRSFTASVAKLRENGLWDSAAQMPIPADPL
jgi:hypothetical protein